MLVATTEKVVNIQKNILEADVQSGGDVAVVKSCPPEVQLSCFEPATEDEVQELIQSSKSKSCSLDVAPAFLIKECLDEFVPIITNMINLSLTSSTIPSALKSAIITPILKKPTADPDELNNFRPISNLPYIAKLLEKVVVHRLRKHKSLNGLYEQCQSVYRPGHSTETAVLKVQNDIQRPVDNDKCVFLVLLDLSAAFDTVPHHTLLTRMKTSFGVVGRAHEWLTSYLENRTQSVVVSGFKSESAPLTCGVPQGSVLGPDLFTDYSSPVASLIRSFRMSVHCYADDTQLYCPFTPGIDEFEVLSRLERCIEALHNWMHTNMLKLNDSKTEFIIFGTSASLEKVTTKSIKIGNITISPVNSVRNIGAMFDSEMKMEVQVKRVCSSAWYQLYNISKIRQHITTDQTKIVIHAYVTSKLNFNNALLYDIPQYIRNKLQLVQNAAAKVITGDKKHDHVTPILYDLHWLPIEQRIVFKLLLTCYKALNDVGPLYIKDLLPLAKDKGKGLRSSKDPLLLEDPRTHRATYGDRSFSAAGPREWNNLPLSIRQSPTVSSFISALKTRLFKIAYKCQ